MNELSVGEAEGEGGGGETWRRRGCRQQVGQRGKGEGRPWGEGRIGIRWGTGGREVGRLGGGMGRHRWGREGRVEG